MTRTTERKGKGLRVELCELPECFAARNRRWEVNRDGFILGYASRYYHRRALLLVRVDAHRTPERDQEPRGRRQGFD